MQISFALRASVFCKISGALKEGRKVFEMKNEEIMFLQGRIQDILDGTTIFETLEKIIRYLEKEAGENQNEE